MLNLTLKSYKQVRCTECGKSEVDEDSELVGSYLASGVNLCEGCGADHRENKSEHHGLELIVFFPLVMVAIIDPMADGANIGRGERPAPNALR